MAVKAEFTLTTPATGTNEQTGVGQITVSASGNSREFPELASYRTGLVFLDVSAVTGGAAPTIVVSLQHQDPASLKWQNLTGGAFPSQAAVTGGTPLAPLLVDLWAVTYRLAWIVTGTPTGITFSCAIVASSEEAWPG